MKFTKEEFIRSLKRMAGQKFTWFAFSMVVLSVMAFSTRPATDASPFAAEPVAENAPAVALPAEPAELENNEELELPTIKGHKAQLAAVPQSISLISFFRGVENSGNSSYALAQQLVAYAQSLMGRPYVWGGTSKRGFDCSGFVYHVFSKFDIDLLRSSRAQSTQGIDIALDELQKGDVLFFTGTNPKVRKVGHVGIVNSEPGEPITFVHASSNGGVKVSDLEGYYTTRFMLAKRMLDEAK